jgi:hypothetical protein
MERSLPRKGRKSRVSKQRYSNTLQEGPDDENKGAEMGWNGRWKRNRFRLFALDKMP